MLGEAVARAAPVDHPVAPRLADHQVLEHAVPIHQVEVLMHHADARGERIGRAADRHRPARDPDLAGIRLVHAEQDVHQRGLAGAVLAEQPQDLPGMEDEIDGAVGVHRAEALVDASQLQQRRGFAHGRRG